MIDNFPGNPNREGPVLAERIDVSESEFWDLVEANPELIEAGLTTLVRDLPLDEGISVPVLAIDAARRLVLVLGSACQGADHFSRLLDAHLAAAKRASMLEKLAGDRWIPELGPPRAILLTPDHAPGLVSRLELLRDIRVKVLRYSFLSIGDRTGLRLDRLYPRPGVVARKPRQGSADHSDRLLSDVRARLMALSPEIRAFEQGESLSFRYREGELAAFRRVPGGLELDAPGGPHPRRILGRTDLEEALAPVIEDFFSRLAMGGSNPGAASRQADPGIELPLQAAPLTREEIAEFLGSDQEGDE